MFPIDAGKEESLFERMLRLSKAPRFVPNSKGKLISALENKSRFASDSKLEISDGRLVRALYSK
jgi:hypothetical protein